MLLHHHAKAINRSTFPDRSRLCPMVEGYMRLSVFIKMTRMSHMSSSNDNQRVVTEKGGGQQSVRSRSGDKTALTIQGIASAFSK